MMKDFNKATSGKKIFEVKVYVDGCSKGNPGKAGIGYVIKTIDGEKLDEGKKYLGDNVTNNQAEYWAVICALEACAGICRYKIHILSDSELLVKQLNKVYRIKNQKLLELYEKIKSKETVFESVDYTHIDREKNHEADRLAKQSIDDLLR